MTMENLIPKEIYDVDHNGYHQRLGIVTGILFGLSMGTACFFLTPSTIGFAWRALISICAGVLCGIGCGWSFPKRFRKRMSAIIDRLYAGDTSIDTPPPPEKDLHYRLPCSWKRSDNFTVGGVLYISPQGLLFVPHKMNLPGDRSVFEMGPSKSLKFSLTTQNPNALFKLFVPRPPSVFHVDWPEGSARFVIPAPDRVSNLIEQRVRELAPV